MAQKKINFASIVVEAIMIVFTVLLALTLNEWRSNNKAEALTEKVLVNILRELKTNQADLEAKKDYHLEMSDKLAVYNNSDSLWSTLQYETGIGAVVQVIREGILNPNLQAGAWRSAELSGVINNFDYETIYILSNTYRVQEEGVASTWKHLATLFVSFDSYKKENARDFSRLIQMGFRELNAQERNLLDKYHEAITLLEQKIAALD